jgi:hypothetical protein
MGVITANRGFMRAGITSNILELPAVVFIARNVCGEIKGNILMEYGIHDNVAININNNRASRINNNVTRFLALNTVDKRISSNTTLGSKSIGFNIAGSILGNIINGNIMGNIANSIDSNGPLVGTIGGNIINGTILENNISGDIISNYTGDIKNNY